VSTEKSTPRVLVAFANEYIGPMWGQIKELFEIHNNELLRLFNSQNEHDFFRDMTFKIKGSCI
jgi:hypothetical protein